MLRKGKLEIAIIILTTNIISYIPLAASLATDKYAALRAAFSVDDNSSVMSSETPNTITPTTTPSTSPNTTPTLTNKRWSSPFESKTFSILAHFNSRCDNDYFVFHYNNLSGTW